ncbi:MAG: tetratricopeptide repeat protein [Saprospiraceae bacterium]|nr:tetratricopeptide repeat protein [Saprospiraceae bacterium]
MKKILLLIIIFPLYLLAQEDIKLYNKGVEAHNAKDYKTAISYYNQCLKINPNNKSAIKNLGVIYYNTSLDYYDKKLYDNALHFLEKALKYNPKDPKIFYMSGCCHQEQKLYKTAINDFTKAIEHTDYPAAYYCARSWVYNDLNDHKSRLSDIKKAVEYEPENAEYQFQCGKFKQEVSQEEFKTAINNYNKAITIKPDFTEAYTERAAYYMTFQKFSKALPDLKKAKELGADVDHLIEAVNFEMEMESQD